MRYAFGIAAGVLAFVFAFACSGGGSGGGPSQPCNVKYDCPAGQTCWTVDGKSYTCEASGPGQAGDMCTATPGPAPCSDRLGCVAQGSSLQGTCDYWCYVSEPMPCVAGTCIMETDSNGVTVGFCK